MQELNEKKAAEAPLGRFLRPFFHEKNFFFRKG
ncbi:hypothetical protein A943_19015 [Bacillus sp. CPSM8]|nr:hypothetical protein A943_19015 [Bacillus sp. CPSM8]KUL07911.1 hypothetical protein LI7559_16040 [Bacillus licheniformis LMG 7559]